MLDKLKLKIEKKQIIRENFFEDYDVDDLLDMRDSEEFDEEWMRVYEDLSKTKISEDEKKKINNIREKSFLNAYSLSESSDIASCISDDFEIICKAYITGYNDVWLNSLIISYARGEFPCGNLEMSKYSIKESISMLLN